MVFQKKHAIGNKYFYEIEEGLGFTHNVSNRSLCYYIFVKKGNKNFDADEELEKVNKLFVQYKLPDESWGKFRYEIEPAPVWSEFDYEMIVYSKRVIFF